MNPKADPYFTEGCGRCPLGGTPNCKVNNWRQELAKLREIIVDCGLSEELKWRVPCYTFQKSNIVLISAFKEYCALTFFKGELLKEAKGILIQQTENVQAARQMRFTDVRKIVATEPISRTYIQEDFRIHHP